MKKILASVGNMLFPNICISCNDYLSFQEKWICDYCRFTLPKFEDFINHNNRVAQLFWGRVLLSGASSYLHFKSSNQVQKILHQIKYRGNQDLAVEMGRQMGMYFKPLDYIEKCDVIVPIPLHKKKLLMRGYNQSSLLSIGLQSVVQKPVLNNVVERRLYTQTQTKKKRFERYQNTQDVFRVMLPEKLVNKRVLLVDDVITTGATIEACASELLKIQDCDVSVCSLALSY